MEVLFFLILFSVGIGFFANSKGRNPVGWAVLSFIISPIIAGIILAMSKDLNAEKKIEEIDRKTDNIKMEMNYNQKFNDYRADHMSGQIKSLGSTFQNQQKIDSPSSNYQLDKKLNCSNCGNIVNFSSKYCNECGMEVEKEAICRNCNQKFTKGAGFCPYCGMKTTTNTCSSCGEENDIAGAKFCTNCGNALKQT
jgi:RNA polymerase subunit RPABC4/transcription elongation factor Spt4